MRRERRRIAWRSQRPLRRHHRYVLLRIVLLGQAHVLLRGLSLAYVRGARSCPYVYIYIHIYIYL